MSRGDGHDSANPFGESGTPRSENGAPVHGELSSKTAPAARSQWAAGFFRCDLLAAISHSRRRGSAALPTACAVDSLFAAAGGAGFLDGLFDRFAGFARAFLNPANQLFLLAFGELQIAIREFGPFLFQLALGDVPVTFDFECGHNSYFVFVVCFDSPPM
jgi:hypothetical protein